jgi:lipid-A-disaccharide synthase
LYYYFQECHEMNAYRSAVEHTTDILEPASQGQQSQSRLRIMVSVVEVSADVVAGQLCRQLLESGNVSEIFGFGGEKMRDAGVRILADISSTASVGLLNSARQRLAGYASNKRWRTIAHQNLSDNPPDLLIIIDNPQFNIPLARMAKKAGIPVFYFIPPQIWAWGKWQARSIVAVSDLIGTIFPFESDNFKVVGGNVKFLGHPLMDLVVGRKHSPPKPSNSPVFGLFPGSRVHEIRSHVPLMLEVAERLRADIPNARFILSLASRRLCREVFCAMDGTRVPLEVRAGDSYNIMSNSSALLVSSGSATLEAALLGVPMAVVYSTNLRLEWFFLKRTLHTRYIAMPNILCGREIVPEFVMNDAQPRAIAASLKEMIENPQTAANIKKDLKEVPLRLDGCGALQRATHAALELALDRQKTAQSALS